MYGRRCPQYISTANVGVNFTYVLPVWFLMKVSGLGMYEFMTA